MVSRAASFEGSCNVLRSTTDRTVLSSSSSCARRPQVVSQRPSATTAEQNTRPRSSMFAARTAVGALPVRNPSRVWTRSFVAEMTRIRSPAPSRCPCRAPRRSAPTVPCKSPGSSRRFRNPRWDRKHPRSPCSRHAASPARAGVDRPKASSRCSMPRSPVEDSRLRAEPAHDVRRRIRASRPPESPKPPGRRRPDRRRQSG